ncbi:MAG: T9SS type A sorting domain-containing protein [Bacteroidia bacterium]
MKTKILILAWFAPLMMVAQTGPGGVGSSDGTSTLKMWYKTDGNISVDNTKIENWTNSGGISTLDIKSNGALRPTLIENSVNGYDEIYFDSKNKLVTESKLSANNFVTDQASTFTVCRAENTSQQSCVYTTDPLVSSRFSNHIPWSNTVYFDIGTCCNSKARLEVGSLSGLTNYSIWSYDANPTTGKQLYRNGALLQSRAETSSYNSHASHKFNIGGYTQGTGGFKGGITEIIIFKEKINSAQRIIIENYLSGKYNIALGQNNLYSGGDDANGNYDHNIAGIGKIDANNMHTDAQGTGVLRLLNPANLDDGEFLLWGDNNESVLLDSYTDLPDGVSIRMNRTWRVSEVTASNQSTDVGSVTLRIYLPEVTLVTPSDLILLFDTNHNGSFADETPVTGAQAIGGDIYEFTNVSQLEDNITFTVGSLAEVTPLSSNVYVFKAETKDNTKVVLNWATENEFKGSKYYIERSKTAETWETVYSTNNLETVANKQYVAIDEKPLLGTSYYRLKHIDVSGNENVEGNLIKVTINADKLIKLSPNPTKGDIHVEILSLSTINSDVKINLTNQSGQLVAINPIIGTNKIELNIDGLPRGIYYLSIQIDDENSFTEKIVKE